MKDLLKKFLSFSYGSWVGLIISIIFTMITTRLLLPEELGKASMFTLALNICVILVMLGTDQSFVRFFYEEEDFNRGGLLFNCLRMPLILGVFLSLFVIIFYKKISLFLFEEENLRIAILLIFAIYIQVIYRYGTLIVRMKQKGSLFSIIEILDKALILLSLVALYYCLGPSYKIIVYSTVIRLFILAMLLIVLEKEFWNVKNLFLDGLKHTKNEIIRFGSPLMITLLITWLLESFAKIAIKQWSGFEELGLFTAAYRIVAMVSILQATFSTFWTPVCYENFEKDPQNKNFFEQMSKIITILMFSVAILSIAGKDLIVVLLGKNYLEATNIMPFLVFMPIMYTISETTVIGINFYKKPKWHIVIASVSCFFNILGNWLLVPKYGAIGASIATAFSYIVFFILRTKISLMYYKVNYDLKKVYFMIIVLSAYAMYSVITPSPYFNVLLGIIALGILLLTYKQDILYGLKKSNVLKEYFLTDLTK